MNWFKKRSNDPASTFEEVKIGDQVWMKKNFTGGANVVPPDPPWEPSKYGDQYRFKDAIDNAPPGWHVPEVEEFEHLAYLISRSLQSDKLWKQFNPVFFKGHAYFWTSSLLHQGSDVRCYMVDLRQDEFKMGSPQFNKLDRSNMYCFPVRYIKDS